MYVWMHACMYVCMYLCAIVRNILYAYVHVNLHVYVNVYVYIQVYVYVYVYMYVHLYMYTFVWEQFLALAALYDTALEVHLNIGILKMIMGKPLGLEDLKDVDEVMATQLEWVLDNDVQGAQIWTRVYINHAHTTILFLSHSLTHTYTHTHTHTHTNKHMCRPGSHVFALPRIQWELSRSWP